MNPDKINIKTKIINFQYASRKINVSAFFADLHSFFPKIPKRDIWMGFQIKL